MLHSTQTSNLEMMQQQVNTLAQDVQQIKNSSFFKIQQINENITLFLMKRYPDSGNKPSFSHESAELYVKNLLFRLNQLIEKEKKNNQALVTQKSASNFIVTGVKNVIKAPAQPKHIVKVAAAATAVLGGTLVAKAGTAFIADTAENLMRNAISTPFSSTIERAGILRFAVEPLVKLMENVVGSTVGTLTSLVLPLALIYITVPRLYNLIMFGYKKIKAAWKASHHSKHKHLDLDLLPENDEEDLWDLIGHLATLAAITKLNDQLQLSPGVKTKLKLNITNIFRKLMGHEAKLTPQETLLVDLAKADAEHLITISKKACNPEKICKYEDFAITRSIQKIIETKLKENGNKHPLSNKMKFCLAIVGKLLMDKYSLTQRERFLESLAAAIHEEHIYEEINDENQERDDTHSNIAQTEHHTNNPHPQTQSPFQTQPMGAHDGIYPHQKSPCVPMIEGLFDTPGYYAATNPFVSPSNTFTFFSQPQTSSHNPTPEAGRSFLY